jgi:hypothetical protein
MDGWPYPNMSDPSGRDRVSFFNLCCSFEVFALHAFKATPGWTFGAHAHPMFELNYMIEGGAACHAGKGLCESPSRRSHADAAGDVAWSLCR